MILYVPCGIFVYRHDQALGLSSAGKKTEAEGYNIQLRGPRGESDWQRALHAVRAKIDARNCTLLQFVPFTDARLHAAVLSHLQSMMEGAYEGVPLAGLSAAARGAILESLVRRVDADYLHNDADISNAVAGLGARGRGIHHTQAAYDYLRDGQRIECKSAQIRWDRGMKRWKVEFQSVKFAFKDARSEGAFDELLLAMYTPLGVYIIRHDHRLGIATSGVRTACRGHHIRLSGPAHQEDWRVALEVILGKLKSSQCRHWATIHW